MEAPKDTSQKHYPNNNIEKFESADLEKMVERDLTEIEKTKIVNYSYHLGICSDDETIQKAKEQMRFSILKKGNGLKFLLDCMSDNTKANQIILQGKHQYDQGDGTTFDLNKIYPCVDYKEYFESLRVIASGVFPDWVTSENQKQNLMLLLTESNSRISYNYQEMTDLSISRIFKGCNQDLENGFPADVGIKVVNEYELFLEIFLTPKQINWQLLEMVI